MPAQYTPLYILQRRRKRKKRPRIPYGRILFFCVIVVTVLGILIFSCSDREPEQEPEQEPEREPERETVASAEPTIAQPAAPAMEYVAYPVAEEQLSQGDLILVNSDYGFDPSTVAEVAYLYDVKTPNYFLRDTDIAVAPHVVEPLNDWMEGFYAYSGLRMLNVVAGYRTADYQQALRDKAITNHGLEYADSYIALPWHSEHHTGLAIDLDSYDESTEISGGFDGKGVLAWAVEHSWEYGFVQRYPSDKQSITGINYEEWHFRYVGKPHAMLMTELGMCLEEYLGYLRGYLWNGEHLKANCQGCDYEIYFCPADRVYVPASKDYTISGNNADGFIITIRLN